MFFTTISEQGYYVVSTWNNNGACVNSCWGTGGVIMIFAKFQLPVFLPHAHIYAMGRSEIFGKRQYWKLTSTAVWLKVYLLMDKSLLVLIWEQALCVIHISGSFFSSLSILIFKSFFMFLLSQLFLFVKFPKWKISPWPARRFGHVSSINILCFSKFVLEVNVKNHERSKICNVVATIQGDIEPGMIIVYKTRNNLLAISDMLEAVDCDATSQNMTCYFFLSINSGLLLCKYKHFARILRGHVKRSFWFQDFWNQI